MSTDEEKANATNDLLERAKRDGGASITTRDGHVIALTRATLERLLAKTSSPEDVVALILQKIATH